MLQTLQVIFRTFGANLGEKYKKIADNVWSNEFNEYVKYKRPAEHAPVLALNEPQRYLEDYNNLFDAED